MKNTLKTARQNKSLLIREVAERLGVDAALVSKWENGQRSPSREQVLKLSAILEIPTESLLVEWISEQIIRDYGTESMLSKALIVAEEKVNYNRKATKIELNKSLVDLLSEIDALKVKLNKRRKYDSYRIAQALEMEYTFESNRIEGNTLTLKETDLVVNEGMTISGKSMREHLEAINHTEAVHFIKQLIEINRPITERDVLQIHNLVLRGIDSKNAGVYRNVQVLIQGSSHTPPQPYLVPKKIEEFWEWFALQSSNLHPVILAAEASERLVTIHPFIDGNGRTSRLLMNLILLKNGYVIANIKGNKESRLKYYNALEEVQIHQNKQAFYQFVAETEWICLKRYIDILGK